MFIVTDSKTRQLTAESVETVKKHANLLTEVDESKLWDTGVVGFHSGEASSYAVFFYNCKIFGLRGMNEHVNLACEQFEFGEDSTGQFVMLNGRLSKNVLLSNKARKGFSRFWVFSGQQVKC